MSSLHQVLILCLLAGAASFSHRNQNLLIRDLTGKLLKDITAFKHIAATGLALLTVSSQPVHAAVDLTTKYQSDDGVITFQVPGSFAFSPKPLKTHEREVLFKSEMTKGLNAGVTVCAFSCQIITDFNAFVLTFVSSHVC
jgi:hypothetical protein